jgi:hypothetical protein
VLDFNQGEYDLIIEQTFCFTTGNASKYAWKMRAFSKGTVCFGLFSTEHLKQVLLLAEIKKNMSYF